MDRTDGNMVKLGPAWGGTAGCGGAGSLEVEAATGCVEAGQLLLLPALQNIKHSHDIGLQKNLDKIFVIAEFRIFVM
jgi:hypothetical protein